MVLPEFTLNHLLINSVERYPDKAAVVDGSRSLTYVEILTKANSLASTLKACGIKRGDRVGIYLDKIWEAVVAMLGVSQAGAAFVNINSLLKPDQIRHIMADCQINALIANLSSISTESLPQVHTVLLAGSESPDLSWADSTISLADAMEHDSPDTGAFSASGGDLATIIYTSGSTGRPKGIMLTHQNLVAGAQIISTYLHNTCVDRVLCVLPFSFDYGLNQFTTMMRVGGTAVLQHSLLPGEILKNLRQQDITGLAGVPPLWALLIQIRRSLEREPLTSLRYITNSGGMIPKPHLSVLRKLVPLTKIYLMYGLTEAFRSTYLQPEEIERGPACIGKAIPNTDVWIVDDAGQECRPHEVGELIHRGPTVAMGYWGDEEKTKSVYRPNPFAPLEMMGRDQVVYSGDLVRRDEEGFLYFVGRRDEQIKTGGYRVSPQEVEDLLCEVPWIHEAAAFGRKDPLLGHTIVAVVSLKSGPGGSAEDLRKHCRDRAPRYLMPSDIYILNNLPKTSSGKIDRSALKREFAKSKN